MMTMDDDEDDVDDDDDNDDEDGEDDDHDHDDDASFFSFFVTGGLDTPQPLHIANASALSPASL